MEKTSVSWKVQAQLQVQALAEAAQHDPEFFSEWEHAFIKNLSERHQKYSDVYYSEKQKQALAKLWDKSKER